MDEVRHRLRSRASPIECEGSLGTHETQVAALEVQALGSPRRCRISLSTP